MRRAAIFSAILHLSVFLLALIGLPSLLTDDPLIVRAITVEIVNIDEHTAAPKIDPDPKPAKPDPKQDAKKPPPEPPKITPPPPVPETPKVEDQVPPPPAPKEEKAPEPKPKQEAKKEPEATKPPQRTPTLKPKLAVKKKKERKNTDFDTVLRSVAEQDRQQSAPQTASRFDTQLTISELDAIRQQIERCWNVPVGARDAENMIVELSVDMNPDGTVRQVRLVDRGGRYGADSFYRATADSAMRAVLNPQCSPLRLPADKYDTWRNFTLNFNPRDML